MHTDHPSMALPSWMRGCGLCSQNALHWPRETKNVLRKGKKNNRGSGQHSTNHATAASACQIQQREGFLLKKRGQPRINTVIPREQSRQSATQQPGPTFQQLATFPIPISASSGPINEHNLPRSLCVSVNARNSCNAVWRRERALKMHVRYFCWQTAGILIPIFSRLQTPELNMKVCICNSVHAQVCNYKSVTCLCSFVSRFSFLMTSDFRRVSPLSLASRLSLPTEVRECFR